MNKILAIFSFFKNGLSGKNTQSFLLITLILIMFKWFGFLGLFICFVLSIASDVCNTTNLKTIFEYLKQRIIKLKS